MVRWFVGTALARQKSNQNPRGSAGATWLFGRLATLGIFLGENGVPVLCRFDFAFLCHSADFGAAALLAKGSTAEVAASAKQAHHWISDCNKRVGNFLSATLDWTASPLRVLAPAATFADLDLAF